MLKEKAQDAVGEIAVEGVKAKLKQDLKENWKEYALVAAGIIGAIAGVNILFRIINRPVANRSNIHFYIHVV
jgi:hypothetical protein